MLVEPTPRRWGRRTAACVIAVSGLLLSACGTNSSAPADSGSAALRPAADQSRRAHSCGDLGFEAQTDNGAFGIRAVGVGCERARKVASFSRGFPSTFTAHGFTCRTEGPEGRLGSHPYTCTGGGDRITFRTS